ncbi:PEP-CTERM sorting domain-containing protein [Rheinheimera sp. UJ63]|uniref:PEP-CTERM sorting domain-containing protein n=1 Tax=Rheinheimera sp. UJ63 TaxID=2910157 RepID=UPI001F21D922|nr:PEP-CTERM sorting domain-containing protein [Rheinheimera sp. UJ63]MCF4010786.1 PEP-CTERM sorting domain-containing protein [Rheinheimera sp. UJ63]
MNKYLLAAAGLLLSASVFSAKAGIISETYQLKITTSDSLGYSAISIGQIFDLTIFYYDTSDTTLAYASLPRPFLGAAQPRICANNYTGTVNCSNPSTVSSFTYQPNVAEASDVTNTNGLNLGLLFNLPVGVTAAGSAFDYVSTRIKNTSGVINTSLTSSNGGFLLSYNSLTSAGANPQNGFIRAYTSAGNTQMNFVQVFNQTSDLSINVTAANQPPASVPAPATYAMMLLGLFGLGLVRKAKARQ